MNMEMSLVNRLEDCLAALVEEGKTLQESLSLHPSQSQEIEPLLSLAARLRAARSLVPSPEFIQAARHSGRAPARPPPGASILGDSSSSSSIAPRILSLAGDRAGSGSHAAQRRSLGSVGAIFARRVPVSYQDHQRERPVGSYPGLRQPGENAPGAGWTPPGRGCFAYRAR